jgi:hypothetical protein
MGLSKSRNRYRTFCSEIMAVQFDAFYLLQCLGGEVTLPTVWATDNRHILDNKQVLTLAVTACHVTNTSTFFSANVTNHLFPFPYLHQIHREVTALYCAATYTCTSLSRRSCSRSFSTSRSYRACRFIQNRSDKPKYRDSRSAVFGVIARLPCTISLIRRGGTLMSLANRYWLIPIGSKNSSNRISPG